MVGGKNDTRKYRKGDLAEGHYLQGGGVGRWTRAHTGKGGHGTPRSGGERWLFLFSRLWVTLRGGKGRNFWI